MNWVSRFLFILIILVSFACSIEEAPVSKAKVLTIASDYLKAKDTILFSDFTESRDIRIKIIHKSADDLIGKFRNKGYATGYDIVMLRSLYDVNRFSKYDFFHDIKDLEVEERYSSDKYDFVGFGIDPYVFAYNDDTTLIHRTYSDLKAKNYSSNLDRSDKIPMLAFVMSRMDRGKTFEWIKSFEDSKQTRNSWNELTLLTQYSGYVKLDKTDSTFRKINSVHFPNQNTKGAFYNLKTFAIVDQAEHYSMARDLIQFYTEEEANQRLSNKLNVFGISNNIRLNNKHTEDLMPYYGMIERMLNKIE
jgi:ABC-type thiamine transport system substrate-binding protein